VTLRSIRFVQFDVKWSDVHMSAEGIPLPPEYEGWVPFQAEIRGTGERVTTDESLVRLAVWMRTS
jgi:hypothetical protein